MSTLPTPRTDCFSYAFCREEGFNAEMVPCAGAAWVKSDFARQLERELTEAKAERDALKAAGAKNQYESECFHALCARLWLAVGPDPEKVAGETCDEKLANLLQSARADLSRWRALAEELAGALEDLIEVAGYAMRQPESEFDCAAELEEPRKALARYRAAANPASARTPKEEAP